MSESNQYLLVDPSTKLPPIIHSHSHPHELKHALPPPKESKTHPTKSSGKENASLFFVGTATTILEWEGMRMMTDPNFLHAGMKGTKRLYTKNSSLEGGWLAK